MDKLLETALEAAEQVRRRERPSWLRRWLDERRARRDCRNGLHVAGQWRFLRDQSVFDGPALRPHRIDRVYIGECRHCGMPMRYRLQGV